MSLLNTNSKTRRKNSTFFVQIASLYTFASAGSAMVVALLSLLNHYGSSNQWEYQ